MAAIADRAGRASTARQRGSRDTIRARGFPEAETTKTTTATATATATAPWSTGGERPPNPPHEWGPAEHDRAVERHPPRALIRRRDQENHRHGQRETRESGQQARCHGRVAGHRRDNACDQATDIGTGGRNHRLRRGLAASRRHIEDVDTFVHRIRLRTKRSWRRDFDDLRPIGRRPPFGGCPPVVRRNAARPATVARRNCARSCAQPLEQQHVVGVRVGFGRDDHARESDWERRVEPEGPARVEGTDERRPGPRAPRLWCRSAASPGARQRLEQHVDGAGVLPVTIHSADGPPSRLP